jgi:hypothetical protein
VVRMAIEKGSLAEVDARNRPVGRAGAPTVRETSRSRQVGAARRLRAAYRRQGVAGCLTYWR